MCNTTKVLRIVRLRTRYYWRKAVVAVGLCPDCWVRLNYTRSGRAICPNCGRAK